MAKYKCQAYMLAALRTLLFYGIAAGVFNFLENAFPSGPCVPGLGFPAFLFFSPAVPILFIKNLVRALAGNRTRIAKAIIHGFACITLAVTVF